MKALVAVIFRSPPAALPLAFIVIATVVVVLPPTRVVGNLGDNIGQEIQHFVLGNGMLEVRRGNAFRVPVLSFFGGLRDQGNHEEF